MKQKKEFIPNINIKNIRHGVQVAEWDFIIDRESPVGNIYLMINECQRDKVCDQYENWFTDESIYNHDVRNYLNRMLYVYHKHKILNLWCWCYPKRCHGETIKKYLIEKIKNND